MRNIRWVNTRLINDETDSLLMLSIMRLFEDFMVRCLVAKIVRIFIVHVMRIFMYYMARLLVDNVTWLLVNRVYWLSMINNFLVYRLMSNVMLP